MNISFLSLRYFNAIFIWIPRWFQWIFHSQPQDISLHFSYRCLVLSMDISFFTPGYFIVLKIAKKSEQKWKKKIGMVYRMSVTAFRVHCIYPKMKISLHPWPKSRRSQDKNDDTCWGPCNGLLGGWSHDQFPKMVKNESCSPALLLSESVGIMF